MLPIIDWLASKLHALPLSDRYSPAAYSASRHVCMRLRRQPQVPQTLGRTRAGAPRRWKPAGPKQAGTGAVDTASQHAADASGAASGAVGKVRCLQKTPRSIQLAGTAGPSDCPSALGLVASPSIIASMHHLNG